MHVVTPRIIVAQVFESHEMKKIVFAEKREVSSSLELWQKLRVIARQQSKIVQVLLFPFSNFSVCNDKAEKQLIGAEWVT